MTYQGSSTYYYYYYYYYYYMTNLKGVISGFRREVAENCTLLGYYAASTGKKLPLLAA